MDLGLVAGEASGDLLGAHAVRALRQRCPGLRASGIAGPRLVEAGVEAVYPSARLAVNGYVEVLRHLPALLRIRARIGAHFLADRPRVFMGIDAPDFNFALEKRLKRAGIPTVHFVSPSVWAWRPERLAGIREAVSHMLLVFPFETAIYRDAGIPATYVGHPLADAIPLQADSGAARQTLGLTGSPLIALLPGSRLGEVARLAPVMLAAARRIAACHPDAQFVLPLASPACREVIAPEALRADIDLVLTDGQSHPALAACDVALVASGTATLETALYRKPMVITYRVPALTAWLMRRRALLPWVGLPNILAREWLVPERIQEAATAENLARDVLDWLDDAPRQVRYAARCEAMHHELRQGAAERIAEVLLRYLEPA